MLDSVPLPFQAIVWPLAGGGLILALNRLLPGWVRRLVATAAALVSLALLWALRAGIGQRAEILWDPLNLFRMSLTLSPDGRSLLVGIALAGATAAMALGIRGQQPRKSAWHGLILFMLAGCLVVTMAANVLALAVGSALIDLALIVLVLWSSGQSESARWSLSLVLPGIASTLLIFFSALEMDAQLGHGFLLSENLPAETLVLIGVAGALRAFVFPLHARSLAAPKTVAALLLPIGAGGYLLARVQSLTPTLSDRPWTMSIGVLGLLAGGLLVWSGSARSTARSTDRSLPDKWWIGLLAYQAAYLFAFVLLLPSVTPWPIASVILVSAVLAIWWDANLDIQAPKSRVWGWVAQQIRPWWHSVLSRATDRIRVPLWRSASDSGGLAATLLPAIALASLAGLPFTLGARGRWPYYAAWLKRGDPYLLIILIADTFLIAGLWTALATRSSQSNENRPGPAALVAMIGLTAFTVVLGLAPGILLGGLSLKAVETVDVSTWGLGLLYLLPWLLGLWLWRFRRWRQRHLERIWDIVNLRWLYRGTGWIGQRLADLIHWLSRVGEGEAWWGWALIILALGVILFTIE